MNTASLAHAYRITDGRKFRLAKHDPADTGSLASKEPAAAALEKTLARLDELQEQLYAQNRWSVLIILQAMDAAGKDSVIEHVMSGLNPQGCEVYSFKGPSDEELDHDFLWRCACRLPRRGRIGIFNRSYYEETLVVRVHPEILGREKLPSALVGKRLWEERFEDIRAFERHLARNGTVVLKFFLHVSREEQRRRFLSRLETPAKNWKFSAADLAERERWDDYMAAYEETIRATATEEAPWYVVPADHKWFTRLVVAQALVTKLEEIDPQFPKLPPEEMQRLKAARTALKRHQE
ncbi:MAG TPA: polyphosphate kinase 2 family protein [Opitutaceae bacterium]|nr:polyphosphate kinase 2 family protein [Opitutaceae bacterium]